MKPLDLIQLYADFKVSMSGTAIPDDVKLMVAQEVFTSLPPASLCGHAPKTRAWVGAAVQAEIDNLKNSRGTHTETAQTAPEETKTVPERQARKKSVGKQD